MSPCRRSRVCPRTRPGDFAATLSKNFGGGFLDDVEVWKHKTRIDNPLLTEEDGAVYQHRRWYEQFYVDVAEVTEDMVARFELEVDTTHAHGVWQREVGENLKRREATQPAASG